MKRCAVGHSWNCNGGDAVAVARRRGRRQPDQRVAHVERGAVGLDVADADEHVGVAAARAEADVGVDRPERVEVGVERSAREREHVVAGLERAVVAHRLALEQRGAADARASGSAGS